MHHFALMKTVTDFRKRAAEFDRLAQRVRDPAMRLQFEALRERFDRQAENAFASMAGPRTG